MPLMAAIYKVKTHELMRRSLPLVSMTVLKRGYETLVNLRVSINSVSYQILMTTLIKMKANTVLIVWIGSYKVKEEGWH